jgi:hypothetical protein
VKLLKGIIRALTPPKPVRQQVEAIATQAAIDAAQRELRRHFSEDEIAAIVRALALLNGKAE